MYQLAPLNPHHDSCPGTGRDNGRDIRSQRVENAKPPGFVQMLGNCDFIAQQTQVTIPAAKNEHARVRAVAHVREQFFPHRTVA
ncbi:hypothetical protein D9M73_272270 [compost metagenome]